MNKVKVMLCGVCVMLTCLSCTNTNTVNVLISNRDDGDCRDKYIEVPVEKIHARLQTTPADTLIVMNEKNMPIHYGYSKDSSRIVFRVPLIRKKSQKTYSVNRKDMSLSDNLFRFRSENIYIDVK